MTTGGTILGDEIENSMAAMGGQKY